MVRGLNFHDCVKNRLVSKITYSSFISCDSNFLTLLKIIPLFHTILSYSMFSNSIVYGPRPKDTRSNN